MRQRNKEDIAADVAAHHFHDLRVRNVLCAGDFALIAGIDTETPVMFAVAVEFGARSAQDSENDQRERGPLQSNGGFFWERSATGRDAFLPAQERRLFLFFKIDDARVVERFAV